jgi:hypothetical protein
MDTRFPARPILLAIEGLVALTAVAGGVALILGASIPSLSSVLVPPDAYLEGSPFASYVVPGILLAVVLGGVHAIAFVAVMRRTRYDFFLAAAAGFAALIWIFVQMLFIPLSFLQAIYFVCGLAEVGLVMVLLGLFAPDRRLAPSRR